MLSETKISLFNIENPPILDKKDLELQQLRSFVSNVCVTSDIIYYSYNGTLYFIDLSKNSLEQLAWQKNPLMPFGKRIGQSMAASKQSIVFFGGHDDFGIYYNDMWIYDTVSDSWTYVTTSVFQRAFHASAVDNQGNVIISGGKFKDKIFDDIYLINLKTNATTKITVDFDLKFYNHSLIQLPNGQLCLMGGYNGQNKVNTKIKLLDLENKKMENVDTEFDNVDVIAPNITYSYDLLMVAGSKNEEKFISTLMMFSFENKIWIPLNLLKYQSSVPIIGFSLKNYHDSILMLDSDLSHIIFYNIFDGTKSPEFSRDNPEYINFLERNLYDGLKLFKNLSSPFKKQILAEKLKLETNTMEISKLIKENNLLTEDKIKAVLQSEKDNKTLRRIIQFTNIISSNINNNKNPNSNNCKLVNDYDIKSLINEIFKQKEIYKKTKEELEEKAYSLSNRIEVLTLTDQTFNNNAKNLDEEKNNNVIYTSLQIADKIEILQNKIKELRSIYKEKYQKYQNIKNSTLSNYIQLWGIHQNKKKINSQTNEVKSNYYKAFVDLFDERFKLLSEFSNNEKLSSIAKNAVSLSESKNNMQSLINRKTECFNKLKESIDLLSSASIGFESTPINNILICIEDIKSWSTSAIQSLPSQKYKPLNFNVRRPTSIFLGENNKAKPNSKNSNFNNLFRDNVDQWDSFSNEIEKILKNISDELDQN